MEFAKNDTHFDKPAAEAQVKHWFFTDYLVDSNTSAQYEYIKRIINLKLISFLFSDFNQHDRSVALWNLFHGIYHCSHLSFLLQNFCDWCRSWWSVDTCQMGQRKAKKNIWKWKLLITRYLMRRRNQACFHNKFWHLFANDIQLVI